MNRRKLQSLIDRTAKASAIYHDAQAKLNDYCLEVYGQEPGEIDCDSVIDAVFGGCGIAPGMTADAFDAAMKESLRK